MILVDSAAWVDFFNGTVSPHGERLTTALRDGEELAVAPVIVTEVLQGFRSAEGYRRARVLLLRRNLLTLDIDGHVRAADIYRTLRRKGVTIRSTIDCIIAQTAIDTGATLLSRDGDFPEIARHFPLALEGVG